MLEDIDGNYQDTYVFSKVETGKHRAWSMILKVSTVHKMWDVTNVNAFILTF